MKKPVKMPALTDTMESGRLVKWVKSPGDRVERGDVVAEIETDKAITDLEVYEAGYLTGPVVGEDTEINVGEAIAWVSDQPSEGAGSARGVPPKSPARPTVQMPASGEAPAGKARESQAMGGRGTDSGSAAKVGRSGFSAVVSQAFAHRPEVGNRVSYDVATVLASGPPYTLTPLQGLRRIIADSMAATVDAPQFRVSSRIVVAPLQALAHQRNLSLTVLLAKALADTVAEHSDFNSAWTPDGLARRQRVDVGVAMDTRYGLTTPVLRDAATSPVSRLAQKWRELKDKVEHHRAAPEDYRGATVYLSNLGMFPGIVQFDAIVPPGAAAVLSVAAVENDGATFTLNCDHRVVSGADAARFLVRLGERLGTPEDWVGE